MSGAPTGWGQLFQKNPTILKRKKKQREKEKRGAGGGERKEKPKPQLNVFPPRELKSRAEEEKSKCNRFSIRA